MSTYPSGRARCAVGSGRPLGTSMIAYIGWNAETTALSAMYSVMASGPATSFRVTMRAKSYRGGASIARAIAKPANTAASESSTLASMYAAARPMLPSSMSRAAS